ncbi:rhombosortase [Photobacterium sanguinicancri]|uniref:rhombosortase n=1 Tax=Photobacterium sanguinicancri TaxID=875932 RepID=UPI0009F9FE53|nr:rhombosortase [Photobacterium sanguinicancri]
MSTRHYLVFAVLLATIAQLPSIQPILVWDRSLIINGEVWRILTGNLTHTNWPHLLMNAFAFIIITFIFRKHIAVKQYTLLIISISLVIGIGIFATNMGWYAGFSGVLHGLFGWGAVRDIKTKTKGGWLILLGLIAKIGWEQIFGGSMSSEALIGARVATEAHLIGAISGIILGLLPLFSTTNTLKKKDKPYI